MYARERLLKRAVDVTGAVLLLALFSPLWAAIALALRTTSRGPVLYRQTRIGLAGQPFTLLKFRSMRVGCDPSIHEEYAARWIQGSTGAEEPAPAVHKIVGDKLFDELTHP